MRLIRTPRWLERQLGSSIRSRTFLHVVDELLRAGVELTDDGEVATVVEVKVLTSYSIGRATTTSEED